MRNLIFVPAFVLMTAPAFAADKDIVDIAASDPQFSTLVAAVKAAGLVDTLKSAGPFTVLAPTNAAFDKLPPGTVADLLKPENKSKLVAVLTYHVLAGKVPAAEAIKLNGQSPKTVQGSPVPVSVVGGEVFFGPAKVIKADIEATNGVIHVIDTVLLPPTAPAVPSKTPPVPGKTMPVTPGKVMPY